MVETLRAAPGMSRRPTTPNILAGTKRKPTTATTTANITRSGPEGTPWTSSRVSVLALSSSTLEPVTPTPNSVPSFTPLSRSKALNLKKALEIKNKPRKALRDLQNITLVQEEHAIETTEAFKLLYRLFVPNKYLIKNNRVSTKHLLNHLPSIIPTSSTQDANTYIDLNFQIHLFLSTIMVQFVNSWYLTKLNTDNLEFVLLVYQLICDIIKDLSNRINVLLKSDKSITDAIDQISEILNVHLSELVCENPYDEYDIKILNDHYDTIYLRNSLKNHTRDLQKPLMAYLTQRHLIFDSEIAPDVIESQFVDPESSSDSIFANDTLDQIEREKLEQEGEKPILDTNRVVYFRIIVRKILGSIFDSGSEAYSITPLNSKISTDLIVLLLGDLVLNKIFMKLASPDFILKTVINSTVDAIDEVLESKINTPKEAKPQPLKHRIQSAISKAYLSISHLVVNISSANFVPYMVGSSTEDTTATEPRLSFLENSVFKLVDTLTNFSKRKPLCTSVLKFLKDYIFVHPVLASKVDNAFLKFVSSRVLKSKPLSEEFLCGIVAKLRIDLFENDKIENIEQSEITIDVLVEKIFAIIDKMPKVLPSVFVHTNLFRYHNEDDKDLRASIRKILVIFNYSEPGSNKLNDSCELNKLLVINLLDCIIGNLYPEI
ncbi:uncharacterized protein CANTADRAFT_6001 [Suhomyces tanzawaensis NRRL Y-17324]|uniref:PXA domain-containing protein n=1 Tax=Suhomyces tanzawaensis NRRL Y-17324 TaxID=984487 RepID=A0A1E4SLU6_9ASCO|nr:uncharacterized protein CANTADRAFT_6001 [Suhomyces tanzawaensis NRRL Y-17324]ODV80362.1 hypothetical protein CANTADRAFT_6001 [Suhomyces tanzawaensis NRRL Y-17324]